MTLDDKITEAVALAIAEGRPTLRETDHGPEKYCGQCDEWWPADREFFNAAADGVGRLHYCCRACRKDTDVRGRLVSEAVPA